MKIENIEVVLAVKFKSDDGEHFSSCAQEVKELARCADWFWRDTVDGSEYCELTATRCEANHFCSWGEKEDK